MKMRLAIASAFLLFIPGLSATPAPRPAPASPQSAPPSVLELAFTNTRFLPGIQPYAKALYPNAPQNTNVLPGTMRFAVDSRDVAHTVSIVGDPSTTVDLIYQNSLEDGRQANGFSEPFVLASRPWNANTNVGIYFADIAVDKNDGVHVVWGQDELRQYTDPQSGLTTVSVGRFYHRARINGAWNAAALLTPEAPPLYGSPLNGPALTASYRLAYNPTYPAPMLKMGADGKPYLALLVGGTWLANVRQADGSFLQQARLYDYTIFRALDGNWQRIEGMLGTLNETVSLIGEGFLVNYAVDPSGQPTFIWNQDGGWRYGGVTGKTVYDTSSLGSGDGFDMVYNSQGTLYISWNTARFFSPGFPQLSHPLNAMYREGISGQAVAVTNVAYISAIHVDWKDQLHFFSAGNSVDQGQPFFSYNTTVVISRLKDPQTGVLAPGFVLGGIFLTPFYVSGLNDRVGVQVGWEKILMSRSGRLHAGTVDLYTHSMESVLGVRDAAAMVGVFPHGSVNVITGNLHSRINLFATSGVGPSQGLDLVYNSLEPGAGHLGAYWKLSAEMKLIDSSTGYGFRDDTVTLVEADGRHHMFRYNLGFGALTADRDQDYRARIDRVGFFSGTNPEYKLTMKTGEVRWFNSKGRLRQIVDTTGNYMDFVYDGGRLVQIVDMNGQRSTQIQYGVSDPQFGSLVTQISDPAGGSYNLTYQDRVLASVTYSSGPGAPQYSFEYGVQTDSPRPSRPGLLSRFKTPRGTAGNYGWTCLYHASRRLSQVQDPSEVYLPEDAGDEDPATSQVAAQSFRYLGNYLAQESWLTDRRGFRTKFIGEPARSLVTQIHDEAALAGTAGIKPVIRGFSSEGLLGSIKDRWGFVTFIGYAAGVPGYVDDNFGSLYRPDEFGVTKPVVEYTYTGDALNRVKTMATYVTPPEGTVPVLHTTTYDYNAAGQVITVHHPDVTRPDTAPQTGVTTQFEYGGPRSQLTRTVNENGHSTRVLSFDGMTGLPTSVLRDGGTNPKLMQYDTMGNPTQTKEPRGGPMNEPTEWTILGRDGLYRVHTQTDPAGKITQLDYDVDSNLVQTQPPAGDPTTTVYDRRGLVSSVAGSDGTSKQWVDANGNGRRTQDLRGFFSNCSFDFKGRVLEVRSPGASTLSDGSGGGGQAVEVTQYTYDGFDGANHFSTVIEKGVPADRTTRTIFDPRGRAQLVIAPDNKTQNRTFYNEQDQVVATQRLFGNEVQTCTVTFRDARDRVDHIRRQNGAYGLPYSKSIHNYTLYDPAGNVSQTVDPLGKVDQPGYAHKTTTFYDERERAVMVIDGTGTIVRANLYGDDDQLSEVRAPDPATKSSALVTQASYAYSVRKELLSTLNRDGVGMTYLYGAFPGQVATATDAIGQVSKTDYDPSTQRVKEQITAFGTISETRMKYEWTNGLLTETKAWNPESQGFDASYRRFYDQAGRLEKVQAPVVAPEQYYYDAFSQVSKSVVGARTVQNTYDVLGQTTANTWTGAFQARQQMTYDGAGQLLSVQDGNLGRQMTYDTWKGVPLDEALLIRSSIWKIQSHEVDDAGNYTSFVDAEAKLHEWPVDENNRPKEKRYDGQGTATLSYTPGGLLEREVLRSASGAVIATTIHTYDRLGRRAGSQTVSPSGEVLSEYGWDYNARNEVQATHVEHLNAHFTVTLDEQGRVKGYSTPGNQGGAATPPPYANQIGGTGTGLESDPSTDSAGTPRTVLAVPARTSSYEYGPGGERKSQTIDGITTTYTYNAAHQLISESASNRSVRHDYDEWGNEIARVTTETVTTPSGLTAETTTESYGYNHLNLLSTYANSKTGALWQYDYYPSGERYGKTNLNTGQGEVYVPRFGDVVTEYDRTGSSTDIQIAPKNTYVQGTGIDSKSLRISAGQVRRHFLGDAVGTVAMTLDDAGGAMDTSVKDAWGVQIAGGTTERYGGVAQRELDAESGLTYMRHRMYDPKLGRFTQTDPILGNRPTEHYAYARNNPISYTDAMGLDVDSRWGPNATREAIVRGDWRKIALLAYDDFAAGKFEDLERLYKAQDNFDVIDKTGFSAWASKVNGGIAEREADLNRMLTDGPYLMRHQELQKWKNTGQVMMDQMQVVGMAVSGEQVVKGVVGGVEDLVNMARIAKAPSGVRAPGEMVAGRMRTANMGDSEVDPAVANQVWRIANEDPVASASLRQIAKHGDATLDFGKPPPGFEDNAGVTLGKARQVRVFMQNNSGPYEATSTLVHESSHLTQAARGNPIGTQADEYRAFRREFLFTQQRRPTLQERAQIRVRVKSDPVYSQKPEGE